MRAAATGANKPEVYLPATPGGLSYKITAPILINCALRFEGAGWQQTQITPELLGPTIIAQGAEPGWKPPLASSVTAAWVLHIAIRNTRNFWTPTATSKSRRRPALPAAGPSDLADRAGQYRRRRRRDLDAGNDRYSARQRTGSALDAVSPGNVAGRGIRQSTTLPWRLGNPGGPNDGVLNGCRTSPWSSTTSRCLHERRRRILSWDGGGRAIHQHPTRTRYIPRTLKAPARPIVSALFSISAARASHCSRLLQSQPIRPARHTHHIAVTYDGSNARLFLDGVLIKTVAASGTWTVPPYESFMIADQARANLSRSATRRLPPRLTMTHCESPTPLAIRRLSLRRPRSSPMTSILCSCSTFRPALRPVHSKASWDPAPTLVTRTFSSQSKPRTAEPI